MAATPSLFRAAVPALVLLFGVPVQAQSAAERQAASLLLKAMESASEGQYSRAVSMYKAVAKDYPGTGAALIAELRSGPTAFLGFGEIVRHGPSANRLDVVVMGDGYQLNDQNEFDDVAASVPELFERHKLLGEYYTYHNFLRANLRSKDQGVRGFGRTPETALGGYIAGQVQGQVGVDVKKAQMYLAEVDGNDGYAIAIVKAGSMGTGTGGIAAIGGRSDDTTIHEWGHAFGGLSDEYSTFTGHRGSPRTTVNISSVEDAKSVPWAHFIAADYPGVGMYRGGDGRIKGVWRPTASGCAMAGGVTFCPVCREHLVQQIYRFVDPIDAHSPAVTEKLSGRRAHRFVVELMQPKTHNLGISWYVLSAAERIEPRPVGPLADRSTRGPLQEIGKRPEKHLPNSGRGKQAFTFDTKKVDPGTYQVVCRVVDDSQPSGQSHPWVLKDPLQLLQSERCWTVEVK